MKKIILFISLCLALTLLVTSCGGNGGDSSDDTDNNDTNISFFGKDTEDALELGRQYKADGDYAKAIDSFKTAIENNPQDYLSYLELADVYIRQTEFVSAYDILTEGYEVTNNDGIERKLLDFNSANVVCDSDNNIKGKTCFVNGEISWYHVYETDAETELRKAVIYYGADGTEVSRVDLTYNEEHKPLTGYAYYTNTGVIEKVVLEYNSNGQLVKTNEYTVEGTLLGYSINDFDADGNKIGEERFNADGTSHWRLEYIHDVAGLQSKRLTYFYGVLVGETNATYNENGYSSGGSSRFKGSYDRTIEYDFDYGGNHERTEHISEATTYSRVICYGAELSVLY